MFRKLLTNHELNNDDYIFLLDIEKKYNIKNVSSYILNGVNNEAIRDLIKTSNHIKIIEILLEYDKEIKSHITLYKAAYSHKKIDILALLIKFHISYITDSIKDYYCIHNMLNFIEENDNQQKLCDYFAHNETIKRIDDIDVNTIDIIAEITSIDVIILHHLKNNNSKVLGKILELTDVYDNEIVKIITFCIRHSNLDCFKLLWYKHKKCLKKIIWNRRYKQFGSENKINNIYLFMLIRNRTDLLEFIQDDLPNRKIIKYFGDSIIYYSVRNNLEIPQQFLSHISNKKLSYLYLNYIIEKDDIITFKKLYELNLITKTYELNSIKHIKILRYLIEDININFVSHLTITISDKTVINYLLDNNVLNDSYKNVLLSTCIRLDYEDMVKKILSDIKFRSRENNNIQLTIITTIQNKTTINIDMINYFIYLGYDLNAKNEFNNSNYSIFKQHDINDKIYEIIVNLDSFRPSLIIIENTIQNLLRRKKYKAIKIILNSKYCKEVLNKKNCEEIINNYMENNIKLYRNHTCKIINSLFNKYTSE